MSATRLLVLGVVRHRQPVHGYELRRELLTWHVDAWLELRSGSVYHALSAMAREGLLATVDPSGEGRTGGRPARIRYRLTSAGEREYQRLLHGQWWSYEPQGDRFLTAFAFVGDLPPVEAAAALRHRADLLVDLRDGIRAKLAEPAGWTASVPQVVAMLELTLARTQVEIDWCGRVADQAAAGGFGPSAGLRSGSDRKQL